MPSRDYLDLVDQFIDAQDETCAELLEAIAKGVPAKYRELVLTEVRPHIEVLWPISLRCMRDRAELTASDLQRVVDASRDRVRRPLAVATLLSHAAVLSHQFSQAASAGREPVPHPRPAWAEELPILDRQVLRLAADGMSTKQIAERLHYSEQAVSYHLGQLMKLMHVKNRTAPVARALQYQLVSLPPAN